MMTSHQKQLRSLVDRLLQRTRDNKISWQVSSTRTSATAKLSSGIVEVKDDRDDDGQEAVRITAYDYDGNMKFTFDDTALSYKDGTTLYVYFSTMRDLLESAIRSGTGEDVVLKQLLEELDDDDDVPF